MAENESAVEDNEIILDSSKYYLNGITGIWNSYGCIPNPGKGIYYYLEDPSTSKVESMIDLLGFSREKKDIGQLALSKDIYELVVMLPFIKDYKELPEILPPDDTRKEPEVDPCAPCDDKVDPCNDEPVGQKSASVKWLNTKGFYANGLYTDAYNSWRNEQPESKQWRSHGVYRLDDYFYKKRNKNLIQCLTDSGIYLFLISEEVINKILGIQDYKKFTIYQIQEILDNKKDLNEENNIVKLMRAMLKYNFPPHLNWLAFPDKVPPYAMYAVEFKHTLTRKDLGNIWQGTMPEIATEPQEEEILIEHFLGEEEIFGGYDIGNMDNIQMKVFKCKQRAENNYQKYIKGNKDYLNFVETPFYGNPTSNPWMEPSSNQWTEPEYIKPENESKITPRKDINSTPWYNYNWPYDYFSLVELLRIDAGEIREFEIKEDETVVTITTNSDGTTESSETYPPGWVDPASRDAEQGNDREY